MYQNCPNGLKAARRATVPILVEQPKANPRLYSLGSGFVVNQRGHLLTCKHLAESAIAFGNARKQRVRLLTYYRDEFRALTSIYAHPSYDLELFQLDLRGEQVTEVIPFLLQPVHPPHEAVYIGYDLANVRRKLTGSEPSQVISPISVITDPSPRCEGGDGTLWLKGHCPQGSSGAPVLCGREGALIGVVSEAIVYGSATPEDRYRMRPVPAGMSNAIPVLDVRAFLREAAYAGQHRIHDALRN